ncbi:MAG TPA: hypothetical protein VNN22_07500 [Verrucomicrobiae bacterium]|nr:hypothetical protein [Verrucomicrobiae bacterium]
MKMVCYVLGFAVAFGLIFTGFSQPANDNYADRIVLTGTDISFSGTLTGATREEDPYEIVYPYASSATQTVWWEWTAPQSSTVVVEISGASLDSYGNDALQIYALENIYTGENIAGRLIDTRFPHNFFTFAAKAGTNYQIQLAGSDSASFTFRLIATNFPCIVENPQTQTISTNDSVMFGVVATGLKPIGFQWQFKGTNLNGETAPILALNHVLTNQTGLYQVIITNSSGSITSQPANLFVTPADTASLLAAIYPQSTNGFSFALLGEAGRRYRIQSSTNLADWTDELSFELSFSTFFSNAPLRSVVFDLTGADVFTAQSPGSQKFFRAAPFHAVSEECNNNLKMIRYATLLVAYDKQASATRVVDVGEISPYFKNGFIPFCPSNGSYSITTVLQNPSCTIHPFEER